MLNLLKTRNKDGVHREIASGIDITIEGQALKYITESGVAKVRPTEGLANEIFAGVSYFHTVAPSVMPEIKTYTVPAASTYTVTLDHTPIAGTLYVYSNTQSSEVIAGNPAANALEYSIVANVITFNVAEASDSVEVRMRFIPTIQEAVAFQGEGPIGQPVTGQAGVVGVIEEGDFDTSEYDTSTAWTAGEPVRMGADGLFTQDSSGTAVLIPNSVVLVSPNVSDRFLTFSLT